MEINIQRNENGYVGMSIPLLCITLLLYIVDVCLVMKKQYFNFDLPILQLFYHKKVTPIFTSWIHFKVEEHKNIRIFTLKKLQNTSKKQKK